MVSSVSNQHTSPGPVDDLRALNPDASPQELLQDPRVRAMLDVIAHAEGTGDRYDQTFAYRTIDDLSRHPNIAVTAGGYTSTAAGRYQFLHRTWEGVADRLGLPDFSPRSQDLAAVQLMKDRGMIEPLLDGDFAGAVHAGAPEWASLPTAAGNSYYGQPVRSLDSLTGVYGSALQRHGDGTAPPSRRRRRRRRRRKPRRLTGARYRLPTPSRVAIRYGTSPASMASACSSCWRCRATQTSTPTPI